MTFDFEYAGQLTNSTYTDFYVYEWFIKSTGEIFYIGKGRGNRSKVLHGADSMAERIRSTYDTDVIIVKSDLSELEALQLEASEIKRILNETDYILVNRIIPIDAVRSNYYEKSSCTTPLAFEIAPVMYAEEIEHHYFGVQEASYDIVTLDKLSKTVIIENRMSDDLIETVYGNNYNKYYNETIQMLKKIGSTILSTYEAKSVTSWIYCGDINVTNHIKRQSKYYEINKKSVPVFHLMDVWKYLKSLGLFSPHNESITPEFKSQRKPLNECKQWDYLDFENNEKVYCALEKAEILRKNKEYELALELLDYVREEGYVSYKLYLSYAKIYRSLKDYDNELDIIEEGLEQYKIIGNNDVIAELISRKRKTIEKRDKSKGAELK